MRLLTVTALCVSSCLGLAFAGGVDHAARAQSPSTANTASGHAHSSPDPFANLKFRSIGPAAPGGRVTSVAGVAGDLKTYYLGASGGGVWKTTNGGVTWSPLWDRQRVQSIGAIAISPKDSKVVWVGSGEANPRNDVMAGDGVYVTRDGGATWKNVGLAKTRHIARILIDPRNADHVIVGALGDPFNDSKDRGVYVTDDGGKTWRNTLYVGPQSGVSDMAMDPRDPDVLYAGIWQFRRLPWTFTSGGPLDGLYRSGNGGKTWSKISGGGFPAGALLGRIGLAIAPSDNKRVYALIQTAHGYLWRSDDSGAHWRLMNSSTLIDQRPFYFSHIAVDPANANKVWSISEAISTSSDGGKTFKKIPGANGLHPDNHAIWIAPDDGKRVMIGDDGGYILTLDGGQNWSFPRNLAIGQAYHVAADDQMPYGICAGYQDNGSFCGPSNSLDPDGILNGKWIDVLGGDGMWSVPDPSDSNYVWSDLQNGVLSIFNKQTEEAYDASPFEGDIYAFDLDKKQYRFNWFSPIAFAPWDPHTAWFGGNVIFQTQDRGLTWQVISPDLTRNVKSHQQIPGGAITHDVTGAEYADTVIDIEGSPVANGEIWAGTDDGLIQLTRDGGTHWTNVTPAGLPPWGYVTTVAPSPFDAGTAYAVIDRHLIGDNAAYLFKTANYGATWTSLATGLPHDQWMKTIRADPVNSQLLYAGMERSMWISFDGGARWRSLQLNLPSSSVRDLRFPSRADDLIVATHGRALWIFDDLRPLQEWETARAAGFYLFEPQPAYEFSYFEHEEGAYAEYAGDNPANGAPISFYQSRPAPGGGPVLEILDTSGRVVRRIAGVHDVDGKKTPWIPNRVGIERVVWDFGENPPVKWLSAPAPNQGFDSGAGVVPGLYTVRLTLGARVFTTTLNVKPDPRASWTQDDYQKEHDYAAFAYAQFDAIDRWLNDLDTTRARIARALPALIKRDGPDAQAVVGARAAIEAGARLESALSSNPQNDEDTFIFAPGLRERLYDLFGPLGAGPPLKPAYDLKDRLTVEMSAAHAAYDAWRAQADKVPLR
ncbi:MAG TPA: hypothetical protein VID19_05350 [Candidatus Eremiobacteraceae bacterium]|jgi:hypothetical protein